MWQGAPSNTAISRKKEASKDASIKYDRLGAMCKPTATNRSACYLKDRQIRSLKLTVRKFPQASMTIGKLRI